ncbi:hypothetical protein M885DRAFT_524823 [Pelagophyceae sp. CCMP2097]|nr:hypothetical protein M885DRAFT_524823 [Pelagophyceae sp. CCMP2097]
MLARARVGASRARFSSTALAPKFAALLRHDYAQLDAHAPVMLAKLHASEAPMIWHKHGSFLDHLRDVWAMLVLWDQPVATQRLGLFHSAYSNSFVAMKLYDIKTERGALQEMIGEEAENLVYKFCVINRQVLENTVLGEGTIRKEGYELAHIHTGETVHLSGEEAAACITQTIADVMDQSFGWQSELEADRTLALWPGPFLPTLRMTKVTNFAAALRESGLVPEAQLPPVFGRCTQILTKQEEKDARDRYARVVYNERVATDKDVTALLEVSVLNPYVAEPHVVRAQILLQMGRFPEAERAALQGLQLLELWATPWDKRMPLHAWVAWTRCLIFQARQKEWPRTHGGLESLGAIDASMVARKLNTDRLG